MRWLNFFAAITGAFALIGLAAGHHMTSGSDLSFIILAGLSQLSAAAACLAIANRTGWLNSVSGALMLVGANAFAGEIYWSAFDENHPLRFLAPIGGGLMILGWCAVAFAEPGEHR